MVQFARAGGVVRLRRDNLEVIPKQAADAHVGNEPQNEGIDDNERMPDSESTNESGYSGSAHGDVRSFICKKPWGTGAKKARTSN